MRRLAAFGLVLAVSGCATSRPARAPDDPRTQIESLEWKRSLGDGQLDAWARTALDPEVRARALLALGRIQNPDSVLTVIGGTGDGMPEVRRAAAFAAQLFALSWQPLPDEARGQLEEAVLAAEEIEKAPEVRLALLDALGRLASAHAVDRLVERLSDPGLAERAAQNLGVAQRQKGRVPDQGFGPLVALLDGKDPGARAGATYALSLTKDVRAHGALVQALGDANPEARAWAAKGLGDLLTADAARKSVSPAAQADDAAKLGTLLASGPDSAAIEAARALAKVARACAVDTCPALVALASLAARIEKVKSGDVGGGAPMVLAVAQQGLPEAGRAALQGFRKALGTPKGGAAHTRFALGNLDCRLAAALDRESGELLATPGCGFGEVDAGWVLSTTLKEIAQSPPKSPPLRLALAQKSLASPDARVRTAAVELLGSVNDAAARPVALALLDDKDLIVAAAAAGALAALKDEEAIPQLMVFAARAKGLVDIAPAVADALATLGAPAATAVLETWLDSPHATVRHSAAAAISTLNKSTLRAAEVERAPEALPAPVYRDVTLRLSTSAGTFDVKLFGTEAPITVGNFVALAKKGAFDKVTFHRVVPDFVAQGGDPRGDGEGGPGYTIPCEATSRPYRRGTVGMALAGKDTGGSQFFVTLSHNPHLEGRYAAFGEVVRGIEIADTLLEGDTILSVVPLD